MAKMTKTGILTLLLCLTISMTSPAVARNAKCLITSGNTVQFRGTCDFRAEANGSFSLAGAKSSGRFLKDVILVSVTVMAPRRADVRGLTRMGINSRWGAARRSREDRACWIGSGFKVCAW